MHTTIIPFEKLEVLQCQTATINILGATSSILPLQRTAIYISALGRTFEIGRQIKKSIYGEVVGGSELMLEEDMPEGIDPNVPCFRRMNFDVAIKIYDKRKLTRPEVSAERPDNELAAMMLMKDHAEGLDHPHLMPLIACCEDDVNLYSIMPYFLSQELFDVVSQEGACQNMDEVRNFLHQMISALKHMHSCGVAHRDMSLENTLVAQPSLSNGHSDLNHHHNSNNNNNNNTLASTASFVPNPQQQTAFYQQNYSRSNANNQGFGSQHTSSDIPSSSLRHYVVIDFGMALRADISGLQNGNNHHHSPGHASSLTQSFRVFHPGVCGKRGYIAPEILAHPPPASVMQSTHRHVYESQEKYWIDLFQADLWALGVMLFMFVTGMPPVDTAIATDPRFRIIKAGRLSDLLRHWQISLPPLLEDLLVKLLVADPTQRLRLEEVAAHPFLH